MSIDILGLYRSIEGCAVRLETRDQYAVAWEKERLAAWRRGGPLPPNAAVDDSLAIIRETTSARRRIVRVRFLTPPPDEYTRYELEVAYPENAQAGEQILIIDRGLHPEFDAVRDDFVCFDNRLVVWYRYDASGGLLGYERADDPATVAACEETARRAAASAIPFAEYLAGAR